MEKMIHRLLITGSNGRLGRALSRVIEEEMEDVFPEAIFSTRDELDISDYFRLRSELERIAPTVVVNCAAMADVDGCERNRDLAQRANTEGALNVARAAAEVDARVIQISTDLVFDGAKGRPYREEDPPNPLSRYASTKLAGELAVGQANPDHVVLRSSWFFGPFPSNRYPEVFLEGLSQGRSFNMVSDRIGSPTYLPDLARAILNVIQTPYRGILHFANAGEPTSRYHLLVELAGLLGISARGLRAIPNDLWTDDLAVRPVYSALDASRYTQVTGDQPRSWRDTLPAYVRERDE